MCKFDEGNNVPKHTRTLGLKTVRWDDLHVASRPKVLSKRVNCYLITVLSAALPQDIGGWQGVLPEIARSDVSVDRF